MSFFFEKMDENKYGKKRDPSECWGGWCCGGTKSRCMWWSNVAIAVTVTFAIFGFAAGLYAILRTAFATTQIVYTISGGMQSTSMNQVLYSGAPLTMTFPNNMIEWIGAQYNFVCATPGHQIRILGGPLATSYDGVNHVATCTVANAGFSIQVYDSMAMRVLNSAGVTFSP